MKIINGKKIADNILLKLKNKIYKNNIKSDLAVILIGDNPASHLYIKLKEKIAKKIGINFYKYIFKNNISQKKILKLIKTLNQDKKIQGILIQMPLPKKFLINDFIKKIDIKKDVDGFLKKSKFNLPFILAIFEALKSIKQDLNNKKIIAIVNSDVFGKKLKEFFAKKNLEIIYILLNKKNIKNIAEKTKQADVLITACGHPNLINKNMIKKGAILIDGGISKKNGKIVGDVNANSIKNKAGYLSPVPGGIGPITIAMLLKNVVKS